MWNQFSRATVVALALVVASDTAAFSQQQELKWKFRPGQRLDYVVQQEMKMSMDYNGRAIGSTMKQTIDTQWLVNRINANGNAEIVQNIKRIRIVMMQGDQVQVEFDSASKDKTAAGTPMAQIFGELIKAQIQTIMLPTGKIVQTNVPPKLLETLKTAPGVGQAGFSEESLKQMFNQSGVIMPQTPVGVGSKWTSKNEVQTPTGQMIFNSTLEFRGMQDYQNRKFARIDLTPSVRMVVDPNSPVKVQVKNTTGKGAVLFDHVGGFIERTKLNSKMVLTVTQAGESIDQTIDQTVTMTRVPNRIAAAPTGRPRNE
ncbi:MAG: DUF6263 family protein [Planctomycetaceae bacterium]